MPKGVYKRTEKIKKILSEAHQGKKGHRAWNKGIPMSEAQKKKIGETNKKYPHLNGNNHYNWKGGITPINQQIRKSFEYKLWREAVFKRDNYTCIWCGDNRGGNLQSDHIKPFALFPALRFAIDNGRTLCEACHKTTSTFGGKTRIKD